MYCRDMLLDSQMPMWDKSVKMAHFAFFKAKWYILLSVDGSTNRRNEIILGGDYNRQIR